MSQHVPVERKPSPPDPVIISWSGLKRWENCPHLQLRTITGKTAKSNKGRIFLPGTVTDLVQRRWLDQPNPEVGQMPDMVEEVFNEIVELGEAKIPWIGDPEKDKAAIKSKCRKAVAAMEPWLMKHVVPFDYQPEYKFKAHLELPYVCAEGVRAPVTMIGGVDLLVRDDSGKFKIYDLKMSESDSYLRETLAQLTFYDLAVGIIQGDFEASDRWGLLAPLHKEFFIPTEIGRDERRYMMGRILKYAQGVWTDSWEPKADDVGCTWCEAKGVCDKFKVVPTVEANGVMRASFMESAARRAANRT